MEFRKTFEVRRSPAELWSALEEAKRDGRWWLPGFLSTATEVAAEPPRQLVATKDSEPCAGTQIVVTFEAADAGARVTVVQSGFPAGIEDAIRRAFLVGWDCITADFAAFLLHGIDPARHDRPWGRLGCRLRETAAGVEVTSVSGGLAASAGLRERDVVVAVGPAPIVLEREVLVLARFLEPGTSVELSVLRDGELVETTGKA